MKCGMQGCKTVWVSVTFISCFIFMLLRRSDHLLCSSFTKNAWITSLYLINGPVRAVEQGQGTVAVHRVRI